MNKIKKTILLLVCSFGLMSGQFAHASVITDSCVSSTECSLNELVAGGSITIDDLTFSGWNSLDTFFEEFNANDVRDGAFDTSQIFVAGIDAIATGNLNEFILGLKFFTTSGLSLPFLLDPVEGAELELNIDYDATATSGTEITATKLQLGDRNLGSNDSYVEVNLDEALLNLQVFDELDNGTSDMVLMADETFASAQTSLALTSNIQMGTFIDGDVELFDFSVFLTVQTDPVTANVPEPSGTMLLFLSLALLVAARYRRLS